MSISSLTMDLPLISSLAAWRSAIVGPARGDLFVGTGAEAGVAAGNLRDAIGFVVLLPRRAAVPGAAP